MSKRSFELRLHRSSHELQELRGLAELLGFNPEESTLCKILKLRELLSQGLTLREAREVLRREFGGGLGWKSIEKYKLLIYMDPRVPVMPPREFLKEHSIAFRGIKGVNS